jgi:hypothetical protein
MAQGPAPQLLGPCQLIAAAWCLLVRLSWLLLLLLLLLPPLLLLHGVWAGAWHGTCCSRWGGMQQGCPKPAGHVGYVVFVESFLVVHTCAWLHCSGLGSSGGTGAGCFLQRMHAIHDQDITTRYTVVG